MLDRATSALREALGRLRRDGTPADLLAHGRRHLDPATLQLLGLRGQPFSDQTPPEDLYVDDAIRMQINMISQQLVEGEVLPVLRGEAGSGRTSVLIRLMTDHARRMHFFVARGGTGLKAQRVIIDMLRMLVRPVPEDPAECYRDLARRLRALMVDGQPAVLVIDDADRMPDREIANILALHDSLRRTLNGGFRTLLVGDPGFDTRLMTLDSEQIRAGQLVAADVRPMSRPRIGPFLEHRLRVAGREDDAPFSATDLERIFAATGGLPRDVEIAAAAALEARFGTGNHRT